MEFLQYRDDDDEDNNDESSGYNPDQLRSDLVHTSFNSNVCSMPLAVFSGVPSSSSSSSSNPFHRNKKPAVDTSLNLPAELMYAPIAGPHHPRKKPSDSAFGISKIEYTSVADYTFREQHNSFAASGHALDCTTGAVLGTAAPGPARSNKGGKNTAIAAY
jgi:hypothetical protein